MEATWQEQLRAVGLRVTRPRLLVLQVLAERPHADVDTIVTAAREDNGLLGETGAMPSGEEIASEFERFLADRDRRRD